MANVLWLVWDDVPFSRAQRNFLDLWDQFAHKVDFLHLVDGKADSRALQRQVLDADAVIMDDDAPLRMPGIVNALRTAVDGGTRMLVLGHEWAMNAHQHAEAVTFVEHSFGIRLGRERVHDLSAELSRLVAAQGPGQGFREAFLDGIDEGYLLQATRLRMNRDAFGLLTAPAPVLVTDRDTPVTVEPGEAVHVMGAWPVSDGAEPQVIVVGSAILPTTAPNDGLRKNLPFVGRLIEWMTTRPAVPQLARNAALAVLDLELVIHDAVALVLSDQLGTEWWSQTLRPIQVKAAERWIEAGSPKDTPQSAFCDLGDLIDIIAKHWDIFQPLVSTDKRGRDKFRGDAEPILRARNRVAHPIRARYAPLSAEDWDDIRRWGDRFASILSHTLRGRWEAEMRQRWRAEEGRVDEAGVEKRVAKAIASGFVVCHDGEGLAVSNAYFRWCSRKGRFFVRLREEEDRAHLDLIGPTYEEERPPVGSPDDSPERAAAIIEMWVARPAPAHLSERQLETLKEEFLRHAPQDDILSSATTCLVKNLPIPIAHTLAVAVAHAIGIAADGGG